MHTDRMLDVHAIKTKDLQALSPVELAELAAQMLAHIGEQSKHIGEQSKRIDKQAQAIKWRDAKIESITFQLARLKAWKFGAKTERMNAEQREIFEETLAADQADLEARLAALQGERAAGRGAPDKQQRRQPKREALPPHLPRVDQRVEPEDTNCPTPECHQPMVRVGDDINERLDIVPAQFRVQRQIRGKWAYKYCQLLVHDGFGVWCAARRLNKGSFEWPRGGAVDAAPVTLTKDQFDALILGLPWQRLEQMRLITRV